MTPFSKEDKILIRSLLHRLVVYNSFRIKVGRTTASSGCWWSWESSEKCDA